MCSSYSYGLFVFSLLCVVPSCMWSPITLVAYSTSIGKLNSLVSSQWLIGRTKSRVMSFE